MKHCPFCHEAILDEAIKCRYCTSMLISPAQTRADTEKKQITYVVDSDLLRFAKFSASVLAVFALIGAFFYGFDIKQAAKEIKAAQAEVTTVRAETQEAKAAAKRLTDEANSLLADARAQVASISKSSEEAQGIVAALPHSRDNADMVRTELERWLAPVLTVDQLKRLHESAAERKSADLATVSEVSGLVEADVGRAVVYYRERGFKLKAIPFEISSDRGLENAYWEGSKLVFGMGLVNSSNFGPYESGVVLHEATHALFNIKFQGQSGSISEHVCDVMAVAIRGGDWSIGSVRSTTPPKRQVLRSLSSPGTAFNTPTLGKDAQVSHIRNLYTGVSDSGGVHINNGILNKAAYLMSEGGTFSGSTIPRGVGREALGRLYSVVIRRLASRPEWTFASFRELVLQAAKDNSYDARAMNTIAQAFAAVGL